MHGGEPAEPLLLLLTASPAWALARDEQRERMSRPLLRDETASLRRAARPAADCSLGQNPAARDRRGTAVREQAVSARRRGRPVARPGLLVRRAVGRAAPDTLELSKKP